MKKNTSQFLLALALVLSLFLSGCGQSPASAPPSGNDSANTPVNTITPASEPESPEDTQPVIADTPAETDPPAEGTDVSAGGSEKETPDTAAGAPETNAPETDTAAPEESASVSAPESGQTTEPASASETDTTPAPSTAPVTQEPASTPETTPAAQEPAPAPETDPATEAEPVETPAASNTTLSGTDLTLRFGGGEEFTIHMYDNDTANKITEYVGTASWQLPIYHFDDYDGWESFQYYDIPSRYDIPDGSQSVTSEKAGAVYYSHPNRIILFYQDAEISAEYTPVGYVDFSQDLVDAVENNPVVEGWGNKLIFIQP